jgi:hypothetical protein
MTGREDFVVFGEAYSYTNYGKPIKITALKVFAASSGLFGIPGYICLDM